MRSSADRGGRARSSRLGAPYLVPTLLALVAAVLLWANWGRIVSFGAGAFSNESPETQVREALRHQERARLDEVYGFRAGGTVELAPVRYADVAVAVEGRRADVVAVLDADGRAVWRDEEAKLSYLGRERFGMTPCPIALWCADGRQFARLRGVLSALVRREDAFNAADPAAYARVVSDAYAGPGGKAALLARLAKDLPGPRARERILAWQIRAERDRATVGEDYEVRIGDAAPRRLRARYDLVLEGDRWRFVDGL